MSAPLWIITLLGICVTALGIYVQVTTRGSFAQMGAGTLSAIGGGIIGAAISIYFAAGEGRDTLRAVRDVLAGSLRARMRSSDKDLDPVRQEWHFYHVTQVDGSFVWRYTNYRFDHSTTTGSITSTTTDIRNGKTHTYHTEVAVRGSRLLLVEEADGGTEPTLVAVMPYFTESFRDVRAGIFFIKSWDGTDLVTKCLWSTSPLTIADGVSVKPDDFARLEELWKRSFAATQVILPSTIPTQP